MCYGGTQQYHEDSIEETDNQKKETFRKSGMMGMIGCFGAGLIFSDVLLQQKQMSWANMSFYQHVRLATSELFEQRGRGIWVHAKNNHSDWTIWLGDQVELRVALKCDNYCD